MIQQPLVMVRQELVPPGGRDFFTSPQADGARPTFTTGEVASVFFGYGWRWMFNHLKAGNCVHPEVPMGIPRSDANFRQFQLHHIEVISHALFMRGIISLDRFQNSVVIIKAIAGNHGLMKGNEWLGPPHS